MDTRIVNELAEGYKDRSLRLSPQVIQRLGIVKNSVQLRLDEFYVTSIPFELSLTAVKLLAILSEREIAFFEKMAGRPQKLAMSRTSPYSTKPVNFFIPVKVTAMRKPGTDSPYCFIECQVLGQPQELKEMLVAHFFEVDQAEKFVAESGDAELESEVVRAVLGSLHLSLIKEEAKAERLRILAFSPKRLRVFGEFEGALPAPGEELTLEPFEGDASCLVKGKCLEFLPYAEAPGFAALVLEQALTSPVAIKLMRAARKAVPRAEPPARG